MTEKKATINSTMYHVGADDTRPAYFLLEKPTTTYAELKKEGREKVYNQSTFVNGRNACSMFSPIHCIANNHDIDFTREDIQDIIDTAILVGYEPSWGWTMSEGCQHVIDYCRINKGITLEKVRIGWREYRKFTSLGWNLSCGYEGREGWRLDRMDGEVGEDKDREYGMALYGHLIMMCNLPHLFLLSRLYYIDSYGDDYRYKETKINHGNFDKLIAKDTFFKNAYYIKEI